MEDLKTLFEKAQLAERAERYDDMQDYMRELCEQKKSLECEERNLLSVAYKNVVGARRSAWRVVSSLIEKETNETKKTIVKQYQETIEKELDERCKEVLHLLDDCLLPALKVKSEKADSGDEEECKRNAESEVFYLKMKADYYRYLAEVKTPADKDTVEKCEAAYKAAQLASADLPSTNSTRLGLALNFSVFYYEIANDSKKACELAKEAFDKAIAGLDSLQSDSYKDSTLIMQLLRDNLTLWTSENPDEDAADENKE